MEILRKFQWGGANKMNSGKKRVLTPPGVQLINAMCQFDKERKKIIPKCDC